MSDFECDVFAKHPKKVERASTYLANIKIEDVTLFLKAIANENRAKIVSALCVEEELCVCDIADVLNITVANTSSHLRKLYKQGVVKTRRDGKVVYYSLDDDHVKQMMLMTIAHMEERV